jgi:uncharacterized protein (TIGR00255 family)
MRSMTGFGAGEHPFGAGKLTVEVRAVNHRFLDVRVRAPRELAELSPFVEQLAREKLQRGRFEVAVRVEGVQLGAAMLDRERARTVYRQLCELRDEIAPGSDVPFSVLASVPDLFVPTVEREIEAVRLAVRGAFEASVKDLDDMRRREGKALGVDLLARLQSVRTIAAVVLKRAPDVVETQRKKLKERADRLRASTEIHVDAARLEQEIALFADRVDICEELTRLESHCSQFSALLASAESPPTPIGRRLDFLLQEMAREANTLGAKSPDAPIAHAVVEVKAEIERMREQVQNVE